MSVMGCSRNHGLPRKSDEAVELIEHPGTKRVIIALDGMRSSNDIECAGVNVDAHALVESS